jgi:hypothetical protein
MAGNQHFSRFAAGELHFLAPNRISMVIKQKKIIIQPTGFGSKQSQHANQKNGAS